jgi:hypothetical protein
MEADPTFIGRVTRCSTRGFIGAVRAPQPEWPVFGAFCKASAQQNKSQVIGLIYDITIEDDELTRQIAAAERPIKEELVDQQLVRQIPIEYAALAVGYQVRDVYHYALPPQPPLALAPIQSMTREEILGFTQQLDFIPLILSAVNIPSDDLLAASLQWATQVRQETERRSFLMEAGRACARLLANDLIRLENLLRKLRNEGLTAYER